MHVCIHLSCLSHSAFRCCPGPTGRHLCAASLPGLWQGCAKASTCFDHLLQMIPYAREDVSIMEQRWLPCESLLPAFYSSAYMTIVPDVPTIQKCISSAWPPERRFSTKKWKMKIALVVALSQQTGAYILKWCAFNVDILELCTKSKPGNRTRTQKWLSVEQTLGMWKDHLYLAQRWPWAWRVTPNISNFTQKTHNHRNLLVGQKWQKWE